MAQTKMESTHRRHRLSEAALGVDYRIVFIDPNSHHRLHRLASFGLVPGCTIRVLQKSPATLIRSDQTELALDPELARDLYVRRTNGSG